MKILNLKLLSNIERCHSFYNGLLKKIVSHEMKVFWLDAPCFLLSKCWVCFPKDKPFTLDYLRFTPVKAIFQAFGRPCNGINKWGGSLGVSLSSFCCVEEQWKCTWLCIILTASHSISKLIKLCLILNNNCRHSMRFKSC